MRRFQNNWLALFVTVVLAGCSSVPEGRPVADERRLKALEPGAYHPAVANTNDAAATSEDRLVGLALRNNTLFQATLADLGLAWGDRVQAAMLPNPTITMLLPTGPKPLELTARMPLEFLWLRPKRVAVAELEYERTVHRLTQSGLDLIRDVRVAHTDLALAGRRLRLAEQVREIQEGMAHLADSRLRAGDIGELEANTVKAEAARAGELVTRLRGEETVARERLRFLAGIGKLQLPEQVDLLPLPNWLDGRSADEWAAEAMEVRPDVRAAELGLKSAAKGIGLAKAEVFALGAGLNAKDVDHIFRVGPAIDIPLPVFNQNQGGITLAKARVERASRNWLALRDRITNEVREAHLRLDLSRKSAAQWTDQILPPVEAAARQAQSAFKAGNVSYLSVLEANRSLLDSRTQSAIATAAAYRAAAELERCIGARAARATTNSFPRQP